MPKNDTVQYRVVTAEEKLHIARQQLITWPNAITPGMDEAALREKIANAEDGYGCEYTYGAIGSAGRVLGGMLADPLAMWFDGHRVPMCGIGGVVAFPEYRRSGNIRKLFAKVFEDIFENGTVFSHLFPFSHDYYRKFGYEQCGSACNYTLPLAPARRLPGDGSAHEFICGDDAQSRLTEIYENFASRHNMMLSRSETQWKKVFDVTLLSLERLYYWKDSSGTIKAWAKYKKDGNKLVISDIAWDDHAGMLGILQFFGMYEGAAGEMTFRSSPEFAAELYWNDLFSIKSENDRLGMNRVINAARALELMEKPFDEGEFTLRLHDSFAPWNDATYTVKYGGGECAVTKTGNTASPDIETDERSFLQMVLGVYELPRLAAKGDVEVRGNLQTLERVFRKKPLLITDFF